MQRYGVLLGRALLALIFLVSALHKLAAWQATVAYMASRGMPAAPAFLVAAVALEIAGSLSLLLGFRARVGAALLIAFLVPTTLVFHCFWTMTGAERQVNMIMFLKNLAIMGGLLLVAAFGPGPASFDARGAGS